MNNTSSDAAWHANQAQLLRAAVMDEFGTWTPTQDLENIASIWRTERSIFAVNYGKEVFPKFQFDVSGTPRPVIARIIAAFPINADGWRIALWITGPNGYLGGKRPVDLLERDPDAVAAAAQAEFASVGF